MGEGVLLMWHENYLHSDDIRAAAGLRSVGGAGLRASLGHVAHALGGRGWGPAHLKLPGQPELRVGGAGGKVVEGDAHDFLLAATGRLDPGPLGLDESVNIYG
jgi:hypothetical protein